jgi:hypothetical protein
MGAALTTQNANSNSELRNKIDYIAKNFIFDSDFTDMTKLGNEKYCNKLVKKVSDEFKKNKDSIDIVLLRKKLYEIKKIKIPELNENENENEFKIEKNANVKMTDLQQQKPQREVPQRIEQQQQQQQEQEQITGGVNRNRSTTHSRSPTTRKRIPSTPQNMHNIKKKCNEIAKFYVLFAHLFSCIVSTVNPSFEMNPSSASSSSSSDKKGSASLDFCSSRLNLLINGELIENSEGDITIKPNVCKTNISDAGSALRLIDLPGIKALLKLFENGGDNSRQDVEYLYKAFTGKDPPSNVNIEHIPLKVYSKDVECSGSGSSSSSSSSSSRSESRGGAMNEYQDDSYRYRDRDERDIRNLNVDVRSGIYSTGVIGNPTKEKLFSDYIKNIKFMIQKSEKNRSLLLEILSEMFTYTYDNDGEISGVIINPSLTFKELQSLVRRTRKIIIKLYTECEEDYNEGLDIFFALIQEKILSKLTLQDDVLRRELEQSIFGKQERYIPVNPFQNPFQNIYQNQNPNKNQFVPPHFKQNVIKEYKQILKELDQIKQFPGLQESLNEWIDYEIQSANGPEMLDPSQVANEFHDSVGEDEDDDVAAVAVAAAPPPAPLAAAPPAAVAAAAAAAAPPLPLPPPPPSASPRKAKP